MKLHLRAVAAALVAASVIGAGVGLYEHGDVPFLAQPGNPSPAHVHDWVRTHGKVTCGRIGVAVEEVDPSLALAYAFDMARPEGALVSSVDPDGTAAKVGLEAGNVILKFIGKPISRASELPALVAETKPGTRAGLLLRRDHARKGAYVTVGKLGDAQTAAMATPCADGTRPSVGMEIRS